MQGGKSDKRIQKIIYFFKIYPNIFLLGKNNAIKNSKIYFILKIHINFVFARKVMKF